MTTTPRLAHPARACLPAAAVMLLAAGAACSTPVPPDEAATDAGASPSGSPSASSVGTASASPRDAEAGSGQELRIAVGEEQLTATLRDSAAARDLLAQLPVTVEMSDHGGVEKTGRLPGPLSLDGQPEGADPAPGDIGYYAPGNDLVLYYGDQGYYDGIVRLGTLHGDVAAIGEYDDVTVRVGRAD